MIRSSSSWRSVRPASLRSHRDATTARSTTIVATARPTLRTLVGGFLAAKVGEDFPDALAEQVELPRRHRVRLETTDRDDRAPARGRQVHRGCGVAGLEERLIDVREADREGAVGYWKRTIRHVIAFNLSLSGMSREMMHYEVVDIPLPLNRDSRPEAAIGGTGHKSSQRRLDLNLPRNPDVGLEG